MMPPSHKCLALQRRQTPATALSFERTIAVARSYQRLADGKTSNLTHAVSKDDRHRRLRRDTPTLYGMLQVLCLATVALSIVGEASAAINRPNVVLIISDDQGFGDYGFMGNDSVRTPHLDRLANESVLYTRGYTMPVCSPSLASLLTGQFPRAHGITGNDLSGRRSKRGERHELANRLLTNALLLPRAVSEAGYLSFQTGKLWNVTYEEVGFTHGMTSTAGRHGDAGLKIGRQGMQPIFDFIDKAVSKKKPFFIWHAPFMPHTPHTPPEEILAKYRGRGPTPAAEKYYAMVDWFDQTCGELDRGIKERGLSENTVILYLADNGWDATHAKPVERAKLSPYELGIRTPMFVRWPQVLAPERDDETLAHVTDFVPTILEITGTEKPPGLPGKNLLNRVAMRERDTVFINAFNHDIADLDHPGRSLIARVVIEGWWKLIVPGPATPDRRFATVPEQPSLYDLESDPLERVDLATKRPEVVRRLQAKLSSEWDHINEAAP